MSIVFDASQSFSIAGLKPRNRVVLAPMSGVTDLPFRKLAHAFGAGLVVSEMVASQELVVDNPESQLRMDVDGLDIGVVQLAGRQAEPMAEAARIAEAAGASVIDINMGCPAKKVTGGYSGSALMRDLDHALTLIEATVDAVDVPVTLKMRLGWDDATRNAAVLALRAEGAGVQAITVHGRTRNQFYKGTADWEAIGTVNDAVRIPVTANGDLAARDDIPTMIDQSGCDALMVGRACYGRPWLPGYLASPDPVAFLEGLPAPVDLIRQHYLAMVDHHAVHDGIPLGIKIARKHLGWYLDPCELAAPIGPDDKRQLLQSEDPDQVLMLIERIWDGASWRQPKSVRAMQVPNDDAELRKAA